MKAEFKKNTGFSSRRGAERGGERSVFRLLVLWLDVERRVVRRVLLLEFLHPFLAGARGREAPFLAVVVPIVGIEFLCALEVFGGEVRLTGLPKPHGQLEARFGFHLARRARPDAFGELLVREYVSASFAVRHPVSQRLDVRVALDHERLAPDDVGSALRPR